MICYVRGLLLKHGDRILAFTRKLNEEEVQFEYTDNGQLVTERLGENYRAIKSGKYKIAKTAVAVTSNVTSEIALPLNLTNHQEQFIAQRMAYVNEAIRQRISPTSPAMLKKVINETYMRIQQKTPQESFASFPPPSASSLRNWIKRYKKNGSVAHSLLDLRSQVIRPKRIDPFVEEVMDDMITKRYMKLRGDSVAKTHEHLAQAIRSINKLQGKECVAPSCKTVNRRINEIPEFLRDKARYGTAFANNKWRYSLKGDLSTRILERVEVDHTLLDIWVLDPMTGIPLGRPWITIFIDRMSGYILGLHISFYGPSAATIAAALKNSIEPKDLICSEITGLSNHWSAYGIGELYVMDNGLEMHSSMFRRIGWELQTDFLYNPVRKPWLKASIERTMMEVCRVLPMAGKVYSPIKNSIPEDPHKTAAILFDDLCEGLIRWAVDVYPMRVNRETLARPFDLWHEGIETGPAIILPSTMNELELSMGIAIERTIGKDGALFQYIRFNSVELQDYCRNGSQSFRTEIRINPDDLGSVHAFMPKEKKWLQLDAVRPDQDYAKGLSLLQHQIIRNEAGKRLKRINAEEQLREAQYRLHCHWSEATSKGKRLRKKMNLVRLQGLTSARVIKQEEQRELPVPESSEIMKVSFEKVNPFKAFSLEEE